MDPVANTRELSLTTTAQEVSMARRFAVSAAAGFGGDEDAQDRVRTLVSELVSNVVLHAATASVVTVRDDRDVITVLVTDGSGAPVRTRRTTTDNATGRGLAMVQALSADHGSHGSDRIGPAGKTIWFTVPKSALDVAGQAPAADPPRVPPGRPATSPDVGAGSRAVVTIPDNPPEVDRARLHEVLILGAPLRLWKRSSLHTADLMREFALLLIGRESGTTSHEVPHALLQLVADLRTRYAGVSSAQTAQLEAAVEAGELTLDVTHHVPPEVGDACQTLLDLLEAADGYCAAGTELLTLVSPPDQQAFRRWYLLEFVRQVQGQPPLAWSGSTD